MARGRANLRGVRVGRFVKAGWHAAALDLIEPVHTLATTPSGHSCDPAPWRQVIAILIGVLPADSGSFLDVGCANGHLMDTLAGPPEQAGSGRTQNSGSPGHPVESIWRQVRGQKGFAV